MADEIYALPYADIRNPFSVGENGAFADYILRSPEKMPDLVIGSSVLIKDQRDGKQIWTVGTVREIKVISPFQMEREHLLYIEDEKSNPNAVLDSGIKGPHSYQPMLVQVELDKEITKTEAGDPKFIQSAVQRPPSSASKLFFPKVLPEANAEDPSLQEMLDIRQEGLKFGAVGFGNAPYEKDGKFLVYRWDIDKLDNKHVFIVGQSSSGKTLFLKNLASEIRLHDKKTRIIMTDLQGDISQLLLPDLVNSIAAVGWQARISRSAQKEALDALGPFRLIIPVSNEGDSDEVVALQTLAERRDVDVQRIGLRLQDLSNPSDVEYLFRVVSEQVAMLLDEEAQDLRNKSTPVTIPALREAVQNMLRTQQRQSVTGSGGTVYFITTAQAALRALINLSGYFDFHQPSMERATNPLDTFNFNGTTILYLEHLDYEERQMWEMQLVNWLYAHKKDPWEAFVFFDEAHDVVPKKSPSKEGKETFFRLRKTFERLAREGRKFGIHLVLSTQSPQDLHEIVPQQCDTRIVMKIDPKNAEVAYLDKNLALIANSFGRGQFWCLSPLNGTANWVRLHSWVPALPHSKMTPFWERIKAAAVQGST